MICLLSGHIPIEIHGHGEREGHRAVICQRCGKAMDDTTDDINRRKSFEMALPARGYDAAARAHFAGKR